MKKPAATAAFLTAEHWRELGSCCPLDATSVPGTLLWTLWPAAPTTAKAEVQCLRCHRPEPKWNLFSRTMPFGYF